MSAPKKKWPLVLGLLALCVVIAIVPLLVVSNSEFGGSDGQGEELIGELAPDYEPWASPILEPPGGETESLLFCVQAAIGGGILGYGFGFFRGRARGRAQAAQADANSSDTDDEA